MTPEQIRQVLHKYDTELGTIGHVAERAAFGPSAMADWQLNHVRWMCQRTLKFLPDPYCACSSPSCDLCHPPPREDEEDIEKAMRWLGFIQGVLWTTRAKTIDEMKDDNRGTTTSGEG